MGIYNVENDLKTLEKRVETLKNKNNSDLILKFEKEMIVKGMKGNTITSQIRILYNIAIEIEFDFQDAKKDDIISIVSTIERSDKTDATKRQHKAILKKFYKWMNKEDIVEWIKPKKCTSSKMPDELLNKEDITKMIDTAKHPRDKALIAILYDTGARIGEIGDLLIKNIKFDQYGGTITVNGKTGMRRIRIVFSVPYLASWLDIHPEKNNPNTNVWINLGNRAKCKQMKYQTFRMLIKRIAEDANINKRIYNHLFRHSRSTEFAQHLTEAQMEEHFGWVLGSDMPSTYIHLSGKQIDDAILKIHGIKKEEETESTLKNTECPRCKKINAVTSKFCAQCGMALNIKSAVDADNERSEIMEKLMDIVETNPELLQMLNKLK